MPDDQPQWTKAEEPTAAKEYIRSSLSGTAEAVKRLTLAVRALNRALLELRSSLPPGNAHQRC